MKTFWIVLAVLFGCGVLCCGGLFFFGKAAYEAGTKLDAQADAYALQATNAICKTWDQTEIKKRLAPSASPGLATRIEEYGKKLGPLQKAGPFTSSNFSMNSVRVFSTDSATFKNGDGDIRIALTRVGDSWQIEDFTVTSSVLDAPGAKV